MYPHRACDPISNSHLRTTLTIGEKTYMRCCYFAPPSRAHLSEYVSSKDSWRKGCRTVTKNSRQQIVVYIAKLCALDIDILLLLPMDGFALNCSLGSILGNVLVHPLTLYTCIYTLHRPKHYTRTGRLSVLIHTVDTTVVVDITAGCCCYTWYFCKLCYFPHYF